MDVSLRFYPIVNIGKVSLNDEWKLLCFSHSATVLLFPQFYSVTFMQCAE